MTFLNPAVLIGLLAASIPILIHLLNLRKLQKIEFSTLAFLKELQKTKVRKIKLKQWLILLLRILIILFLVMSFARPALDSVSIGLGSTAKTTAVLVIDNSFSMSVVNENGSLLNQAKSAAKQLLNEFVDGDEITILTINQNENTYSSSNRTQLSETIENTEISFYSQDLTYLVNEAAKILGSSSNFNKELYIISDFPSNRFRDTTLFASHILDDVKFYFLQLNNGGLRNLSVTDFQSKNQIFEQNKSVKFKASVKNNSESNSSNNVASLFVNGRRSAQKSFDVQAGETIEIEFNYTIAESGFVEMFVELEEDDVSFDNRRYLSLYVPEQIKVLLLSDLLNDLNYVKIALQGINNNYFIIDEGNTSRLNSFRLPDYDVVLLSGNDYLNNIDKLKNFIANGGSVILFPGSSDENAFLSDILTSLSLPVPESFVKSNDSYFSFDEIDYGHPVFTNLFEEEKKQIDSPEILKYLKLFNQGKGKTLIKLVDGSAFLSEYSVGSGKVVLFSSLPSLSWSNLPVKGIFAPLITKLVSYLTFIRGSESNYIVGDEIVVSQGAQLQPQIKIIRPDNSEQFIQPELKGFNKQFVYSDSELFGIYKFYTGDRMFEASAVNLDILESSGEFLESDEIENEIKNLSDQFEVIELSQTGNYSEAISQARFGTELWKIFLILALCLALIEMFVSKSSKKDIAELN
jgi:ABC-type transporter MlaC component